MIRTALVAFGFALVVAMVPGTSHACDCQGQGDKSAAVAPGGCAQHAAMKESGAGGCPHAKEAAAKAECPHAKAGKCTEGAAAGCKCKEGGECKCGAQCKCAEGGKCGADCKCAADGKCGADCKCPCCAEKKVTDAKPTKAEPAKAEPKKTEKK